MPPGKLPHAYLITKHPLAFTHGLLYAEPMDMSEPLLVDLRATC